MNADIAAELSRIRRRSGGLLVPLRVVEAARPASSPLHGCFEWDNSKAGQQYRIWQARHLICVYVDVIPQHADPARVYVSLMRDRTTKGGGYRAMVDVLGDDELREELLAEALAELDVFRRKYRQLSELAVVFSAIDEAKASARPKRKKKAG